MTLVNRKKICTSIDIDYADILNQLSIETRIPKSKLIDEALELLFDKYKKKYYRKNT